MCTCGNILTHLLYFRIYTYSKFSSRQPIQVYKAEKLTFYVWAKKEAPEIFVRSFLNLYNYKSKNNESKKKGDFLELKA